MRRHIFIGDIHGCLDEVHDLLAKIGVTDSDRVVSLGDLTRKGPKVAGVIDLWIARGYDAVLGNNDVKLTARATLVASPRRIKFLRRLPLHLDFPKLGVVAVHGGVLPNSRSFDASLVPRHAALSLRHIRRDGSGKWSSVPKEKQADSDPFWADVWDGDRLVVYGHTPRREPRVHKRALGLDTGCVYGGKLTAAVFAGPERWTLVSVPARRKYAD
ncbi:MAG: metallophosphoesterase family protein [Acidobacteria bacterium]|nr:metallophosphoesterase family protein [Acidobacteriota bacterium]MBV9475370.1 metallophosphoesterase family protein [Acidobacteriota bacterium]